MSEVKLFAVSNNSNLTVSACQARLRIESRTGNREIAFVEGGQSLEIDLNNGDKVICVYGSIRVGLIFTQRRNGVSVNLSATPNQNLRKELNISNYLLDELIRESLANSPSAPKVDYSGMDLSRMAAIFGR